MRLPRKASVGSAARLSLDNGRGVFLKAASSRISPWAGEFHRRERVVAGGMPDGLPVPRLLDAHDDGDWVALAFEDIEGHLPAQPWRPDELERVLAAATDLARLMTPAPDLRTGRGSPRLGGWKHVIDDPEAQRRLAETAPWAHENLDLLGALERRVEEAVSGETVLHGDLYPFNVLLAGDRVFFVDWPHAWVGAEHADVVTLLVSAALCGTDPQPILDSLPLTAGVDPAHIDVRLSAHAGFLLAAVCFTGPEADPNIIAMMRGLGLSSLRWLARRLRAR
ncbi:hypothetical protein GCM10017673_27040 [Streptosporangium violaceochromogenes]|nr:hypothetical protein GCM10017673_27040 [Streptosporangium violaceochromogenes]